MSEPVDERPMSDYEHVPADKGLALALDTAERMAKEADAKFCEAFGGDGETSAYWLTQAVAEVRAALARLLPTGAAGEGESEPPIVPTNPTCPDCKGNWLHAHYWTRQAAIAEERARKAESALPTPAREPVANVGQPECKRCHGYHEAAVCPFSDALLDLHSVLPVAWAIHYPNASYVQYTESKATADACLGAKVTPLYTHPPTPEAGTVTEAMALAAAREHAAQMGESFDAMWDQMDERERAEFVIDWSVILRKALAGRRGA